MNYDRRVPGNGLAPDLGTVLLGVLLQFLVVDIAVPRASSAWGVDTMAAWMTLSVPMIFLPIIACGLLILRGEASAPDWRERLWLRAPTREDWRYGVLGLGILAVTSGAAFAACRALGLNSHPPFARGLEPLTMARSWMVALWLVYWPINVLGENLVWRGVMLPRMEQLLGQRAWILSAALWGGFHLAFGIGNLIVLLPTLILVPYVAQRRRNTWLAVLLHAGLSGPGFVALAMGLA